MLLEILVDMRYMPRVMGRKSVRNVTDEKTM